MVEMGVVEEGFGGDAADVETGASEGAALFDTCDLAIRHISLALLFLTFASRGSALPATRSFHHPMPCYLMVMVIRGRRASRRRKAWIGSGVPSSLLVRP